MENILTSTTNNDTISRLRGNDLLELLEIIENILIEYRYSLGLPNNLTFGVEIEYENTHSTTVSRYLNTHLEDWDSVHDASLDSGGEINSPILKDERKCWEELKEICTFLKKHNADTTYKAGGHIHVGAPVIGDKLESWRIFTKLYMLYEHVIYRFFYGDKINARPRIQKYAPPVAEYLYDSMSDINGAENIRDIEYALPSGKYFSINFDHLDFSRITRNSEKNTFELRCPNATTEEIIWQNNINTFTKMLLSSGRCVIDEEFLDYKIKRFKPDPENQLRYNEVFLKDALEFSDLVFDCNLDKIYFLRQYIKSFEEGRAAERTILAKRFIK